MIELLTESELPTGFTYPKEFLELMESDLTSLVPWHFESGDHLRWRMNGLRERYPQHNLVPFAGRQDNDDVACWDVTAGNGAVVIIHDFGAGNLKPLPDFFAWLRRAMDDLIEFHGGVPNLFGDL